MINIKNVEMAAESFLDGADFASYRYLGFHIVPSGRCEKYAVFRVWAPNAKEVFLVGDFNSWELSCPMEKNNCGIYEATLPASDIKSGQNYKFRITTAQGQIFFKADPFAFYSEAPPSTASKIFFSSPYEWHDGGYLADRKKLFESNGKNIPLNIYKTDLSLIRRSVNTPFPKYKDLANELIPYVKQMGYTHVELVSVFEHMSEKFGEPAVTGCFSPTARFGTPDDFKAFTDALHCAGIGLLIDHDFAGIEACEHGLACFDGTSLYEHSCEEDSSFSPVFNISSNAVTSFLLSNAIFWIEEYHIDGIVTDLSKSLRENSDCAVLSFFKTLNSRLAAHYPDVITAAKVPSRIPKAADAVCDGGLGFTYVRDRKLEKDILLRSELSFGASLSSAAKSGITALSDCSSVICGMSGDNFEKFAKSRLAFSCMMLSDSKKLTFAGNEIAQFSEVSGVGRIEWELLGDTMHKKHQLFVRDLNSFYLSHPVLRQNGGLKENPINDARDILSFIRINTGQTAYKELIAVINFGKNAFESLPVPVPRKGSYRKVFSSASSVYGGAENACELSYKAFSDSGSNYHINADLEPISFNIFELVGEEQ